METSRIGPEEDRRADSRRLVMGLGLLGEGRNWDGEESIHWGGLTGVEP